MLNKFLILAKMALFIALANAPQIHAQNIESGKIQLINGKKISNARNITFEPEYLKADFDGNENVMIRYDRIKKMSFNEVKDGKDNNLDTLDVLPKIQTNSFFHELRGGLLLGEDNVSVSLQTINGYQFNRYFGTGLGLGVNIFEQQITMPIYATIKGYILDKPVSPFYFGDIGYGFAWKKDASDGQIPPTKVEGGYYCQLGVGYQINYHNTSLVFTLGYINQDTKSEFNYENPWGGSPTKISEQRLLRRFLFSVGFLF